MCWRRPHLGLTLRWERACPTAASLAGPAPAPSASAGHLAVTGIREGAAHAYPRHQLRCTLPAPARGAATSGPLLKAFGHSEGLSPLPPSLSSFLPSLPPVISRPLNASNPCSKLRGAASTPPHQTGEPPSPQLLDTDPRAPGSGSCCPPSPPLPAPNAPSPVGGRERRRVRLMEPDVRRRCFLPAWLRRAVSLAGR